MADNETKQIQDKARELLESKKVTCVIGYERATDGLTARPYFAYSPDQVGKLIFDQTCVHNLSKYLLDHKNKTIAVVAKPCDSRAINLLLNEKELKREQIFIIGVICHGVVSAHWNRPTQETQQRCQICRQHVPLYDFLVGTPPQKEAEQPRYTDIEEIEAKSADERQALWQEHFNRCIRCHACRQACPGCYCTTCFVDQLDPTWVGIKNAPKENWLWQTIRAFHLAGRCIACNQCEQVCPVNIPLSKLNRKLDKEVRELFDFESGLDAEKVPPFATFKKDDNVGI